MTCENQIKRRIDPKIMDELLIAAVVSLHKTRIDYPTWVDITADIQNTSVVSNPANSLITGASFGAGKALNKISEKLLDRAECLANEWRGLGIKVVRTPESRLTLPALNPQFLLAWGAERLLEKSKAVLLNSRQGRQFNHTGLVNRLRNFVAEAGGLNYAIISSYGAITYNLLTKISLGIPLIVICPEPLPFLNVNGKAEFLRTMSEMFDLDHTLFLSAFIPGLRLRNSEYCALRDELAADMADYVYVGAIRSGGIMEDLVSRSVQPTIKLETADATNSVKTPPAAPTRREWDAASDKVSKILEDFPDDYLTHYTRRRPGAWPGQSLADYCDSVINHAPECGHSAFDSLRRMLAERVIRASGRLIKSSVPVVSFTELVPDQLQPLTKWRKGLARWAFEPYGLAFPKTELFKLGIRPVIYSVNEAYEDLSNELRHLFQASCSGGSNWSLEKEWRSRGDFIISDEMLEKMIVIVPTQSEAMDLLATFRILIYVLGRMD